jgi:hypothetical protein
MSQEVLGRITFDFLGQPRTAELLVGLRWRCDEPTTERLLDRQFTDYSPADGQPGVRLLHRAAEFLKGKPEWLGGEPEPAPPGAVY